MNQYIRWGILGAGNFAKRDTAAAINAASHGVLSAIAVRDVAKAAPFAELAPGLTVFDDYDALIKSPDIDAVYISLPNNMHVDWTEKAARAGKAVLCEKPISLDMEGVDRLIQTRDETGRLIAEGFMVAHHPQWRYVRELLASNAIGRLRHVQGVFTYFNANEQNIRNRPEMGGGGLYDIGVYPVATARYALQQEPEATSCIAEWENGVDVVARAQLSFPDDVSFDFYVSMRMLRKQEMVFHGEAGVIRLTCPFNPGTLRFAQVELWRPDRDELIRYYPDVNQYVNQFTAFNRALTYGEDFPCTLDFSKGNQRVMDDLLALAQQ